MTGDVQRDAAVERLHARRQPLLAGDIDDVFGDVEGRFASFSTAASLGTISGHSNFSISAQDGTSAMMS